MKLAEHQIFQMLDSFPEDKVKRAIKLWNLSRKDEELAKMEFYKLGWHPVGSDKPKKTESLFIFGEYWIQTPKEHKKQIENELEKKKKIRKKRKLELKKRKVSEELLVKEWSKKAKKCPNCNIAMKLREVTTPKGRRNVYGYNSVWECIECAYEEYEYKEPEELLIEYGLFELYYRNENLNRSQTEADKRNEF